MLDVVSAHAPRGICDELDSWTLPVHAEDSLASDVALLQHEALMQFEEKHEKRLLQKVMLVLTSLTADCVV